MFTALLSFFGGSAFRMIWGEVSSWVKAKQDHAQELDRMRLQDQLDENHHKREMENIRLQSDLGIKTIEVQRDADIARAEMDAFAQAVKDVGKQTGIKSVDVWNGVIRPLLATLAIIAIMCEVVRNGFVLSEYDLEVFAAILGVYIADRSLTKRGK